MRPDPVELGVDELVRQRNDARSELAEMGAKCSELIINLEQAKQNSAMECGHARSKLIQCDCCGGLAGRDSNTDCSKCGKKGQVCSECERIKAMEEQLRAADKLALALGELPKGWPFEASAGVPEVLGSYLALRNRDKKESA